MSEWMLLEEKRDKMWSARAEFLREMRAYGRDRETQSERQRETERETERERQSSRSSEEERGRCESTLVKAKKGEWVAMCWTEVRVGSSSAFGFLALASADWEVEYIERCLSSICREPWQQWVRRGQGMGKERG
jgi:hypothetical protein